MHPTYPTNVALSRKVDECKPLMGESKTGGASGNGVRAGERFRTKQEGTGVTQSARRTCPLGGVAGAHLVHGDHLALEPGAYTRSLLSSI